jgi:hypothetical protein
MPPQKRAGRKGEFDWKVYGVALDPAIKAPVDPACQRDFAVSVCVCTISVDRIFPRRPEAQVIYLIQIK